MDEAVGVTLVDDPEASKYPMPLTATGKYDVEVRNERGMPSRRRYFVVGGLGSLSLAGMLLSCVRFLLFCVLGLIFT